MYGIVCRSMLLKHLLTYLRLIWINFGLIRIVNICGKPTYPRPEVDQNYYVITMMKLIRSWYIEADIDAYRSLSPRIDVVLLCCVFSSIIIIIIII